MQTLFRLTSIAYWLALTVWIAAIITVAISAMNTFGTLPDPSLGLTLEPFAAYPAENHGRLAAGIVMERNFFVADMLQIFTIPVVIIMLITHLFFFGMKWSSPANLTRTACLLVAAILFGFYSFTMAPVMNGELRAYWKAAEAGAIEQAEAHRATFDEYHPRAELILQANLILVIIGAGASAAAFANLSKKRLKPRTELEEPALVRQPSP